MAALNTYAESVFDVQYSRKMQMLYLTLLQSSHTSHVVLIWNGETYPAYCNVSDLCISESGLIQ